MIETQSNEASVQQPISVAAARELVLAAFGHGQLVLAEGVYSPDPAFERYILICICGQKAVTRATLRLATGDAHRLLAALPAGLVLLGRCDAMAQTRWRTAWSRLPDMLCIWTASRGLAYQVTRSHVRARKATRSIAVDAIASVHVDTTADWSRHTVDLVLHCGNRVTLASKRDWFPLVDVLYDQFMLWSDTWWAVRLGTDLAELLNVPLTKHPDL